MTEPEITWQNEQRCALGGLTFQVLPADYLARAREDASMEGADFLLFKEPDEIEEYVELVGRLRPRNIVELGIFQGGSTAFLFELARPRRLVAIDQRPPSRPALRDHIARNGLAESLRVYDDVDQADRACVAAIVQEEFGTEPLDLVIDDCSHLYAPTCASFNELFPRLRPGGVYVIEDWSWAHTPGEEHEPDGWWADEVPLTRLVFELVLALPYAPGVMSDLAVQDRSLRVTRGPAEIHPGEFDITACSRPRGRKLLAGDD